MNAQYNTILLKDNLANIYTNNFRAKLCRILTISLIAIIFWVLFSLLEVIVVLFNFFFFAETQLDKYGKKNLVRIHHFMRYKPKMLVVMSIKKWFVIWWFLVTMATCCIQLSVSATNITSHTASWKTPEKLQRKVAAVDTVNQVKFTLVEL